MNKVEIYIQSRLSPGHENRVVAVCHRARHHDWAQHHGFQLLLSLQLSHNLALKGRRMG